MTKARSRRSLRLALSSALLAGAAAAGSAAAQDRPAAADLRSMSLEDLASIEITSVSKRPEVIGRAPSAIFLITGEDIRASAAASLPEALRLAPNLQVGRVDARDYSISARGMNSFEVTNKLLVLIDGRSVYTPLSGGVDWDAQQVMLADLERIEVISGPGGTLWGANAVNGVVNVISRSAFDTQGGLLHLQAGSLDSTANLRFGGKIGGVGAYRVYGMAFDRGPTARTDGTEADDSWAGAQAGFRTDWTLGADLLTVQGDLYRHDLGNLFTPDESVRGGNLLGRWSQTLDGGSTVGVQAYYDLTRRRARGLTDELATYDIDARHSFTLGDRHTLVWGGGYRLTRDSFTNLLNAFVLDPPRRWISLGNVFAQDDIALRDDLTLTLGLKLESSSFSGADYMPNLRLAWRPGQDQLLWGAVSRAVRTPSRVERELVYPGLLEKGDFQTEKVVAIEAGYRGRVGPRLSASVSAFYNLYTDIRTTEPTPVTIVPIVLANGLQGHTYGVEAWGAYDILDRWRLSLGVSTLRKSFDLKAGRMDLAAMKTGGNDPEIQATLRSQTRLTDKIDLDLSVRAVDDLPEPEVPGYVEADLRLGWQVTDRLELSVAGFNLLDARHLETAEPRSTEVRRNVQAGLVWRY